MLGRLWGRTKALFFRLFHRKEPPEPGRFETDSRWALRGWLAAAPWIWPTRDYLLYIPHGYNNLPSAPLIVLLHGCKQTPEEISAATRIAALADDMGCFVLLPRQHRRANAWGCWNWFDSATASGWGETAIVAAQIRAVRKKYRVDRDRVYAAGMSAGGALASALSLLRPDYVAGAFVHSGIACGAASSAHAAFTVMKNGADTDYKDVARKARARASDNALPVPLVVIQGNDDGVVAPVNASQLVRQYLLLNGHPAAEIGTDSDLPPADRQDTTTTKDARAVTTSEWSVDGRLVARHVLIAGLGHAWSGGDEGYPFSDPHPPDATALLGAFIRERTAGRLR